MKRNKSKDSAYAKIIDCIASCKTTKQVGSARKMIDNHVLKFGMELDIIELERLANKRVLDILK